MATPRFLPHNRLDDLIRQLQAAGYRVMYWPDVVVVHIGGESSRTVQRLSMSSSGAQLTSWRMRSALLYYRKHHGKGQQQGGGRQAHHGDSFRGGG